MLHQTQKFPADTQVSNWKLLKIANYPQSTALIILYYVTQAVWLLRRKIVATLINFYQQSQQLWSAQAQDFIFGTAPTNMKYM